MSSVPCRCRRRSSGSGSGRPPATRSSSRSTTASATSSTTPRRSSPSTGSARASSSSPTCSTRTPTQARAFSRDKLHLPLPVEPLDWDGASRLLELGHEIGSHTRSHPNLTSLQPEAMLDELATSREELSKRLGAVRHVSAPYGDRARFSEAVADAARSRRVRELRVGDPRRQPLRARPVLAAPPSPERVLAASRARVLPRVNVVVLTRNPHGIASRFLARRPGPVILDEAVGRRDVRRTLRKLRRVGITAAPVGLALRRAYADAGSGPTLESVATEVVRVPSLNGSEARDALRRLGADVAISLDNAIIRPETFSLPDSRHDQRPPRRRARLPRRSAGVLGAPRRARPGRVHDPPDRRGDRHRAGAGARRRADRTALDARRDARRDDSAPARGEPRRARGRARRGRLRRASPSRPAGTTARRRRSATTSTSVESLRD